MDVEMIFDPDMQIACHQKDKNSKVEPKIK